MKSKILDRGDVDKSIFKAGALVKSKDVDMVAICISTDVTPEEVFRGMILYVGGTIEGGDNLPGHVSNRAMKDYELFNGTISLSN